MSRDQLVGFFTTELIESEIADRLALGVELYWDERYDEAVHLVVPRLETAIRGLARRADIPILREPQGARPGGVRSLGSLLYGLQSSFAEEVSAYLEQWRVYLQHLLTDELGLNLRNVVAHGLQPTFGPQDAALLIHVACFLTNIRFTGEEST